MESLKDKLYELDTIMSENGIENYGTINLDTKRLQFNADIVYIVDEIRDFLSELFSTKKDVDDDDILDSAYVKKCLGAVRIRKIGIRQNGRIISVTFKIVFPEPL